MVVHSYEAIIFYGNVVSDLVKVGRDYTSAKVFGNHSDRYSFSSPISGQVVLNNESERRSYYLLNTFESATGSFEVREKLTLPALVSPVSLLTLITRRKNFRRPFF